MRARFMILFTAFGLLAGVGSLFLGPDVAKAAPGNGAFTFGGQIDVAECTDYGAVTSCYEAKGEYHSVCTPAGGCNYQANFQYECFTETENATGATLYRYCVEGSHYRFHSDKAGNEQLSAYTFDVSYFNPDSGETLCWTIQYHYANGRLQYDHSTPATIC